MVFQVVTFEDKGIRISLINKTIRFVDWDSVELIEEDNFMRNSIYNIKVKDSKNLHLDKRKKVKELILKFGNENTVKLIK